MNWISSHLLAYMVSSKAIPNEQKYLDFYRYGIEITTSTILNVLLVLLIGIVTQHLIESIVFLFTFILLRLFSGGYHAESYFRCNLLMCCSFLTLVILYEIILNKTSISSSILFVIISSLFFFALALIFCPVEHVNKPINSKGKRRKLKIITIIVGLIFSIVESILISKSIDIGVMMLLTQILVSALVIAAKIKKGGHIHGKENQICKNAENSR